MKATQRAGVTAGRHLVVYDGTALTWDVLISLQSLFAIAEYAPQVLVGPVALLDLGGGWGRLGNVLLRINPSAVYIDADLPETLLIAESYLPSTLPGIDVYRYAFHRKSREICRAALLKQPGVHFIGSHMLPLLEDRAIDLFVNIASFQEMTNEQVDAYFDVIERVTSGHLYVQQLALSNPQCGFSVKGRTTIRSAPTGPAASCGRVRISRIILRQCSLHERRTRTAACSRRLADLRCITATGVLAHRPPRIPERFEAKL